MGMNQNISILIKKPCSERVDQFRPTSAGGFCSSCQKEVTDFTAMSDREIIDYFQNEESRVCGRFHPSQLRMYSASVSPPKRHSSALAGIGLVGFSLLWLLPTRHSLAQQYESPTVTVAQEPTSQQDSNSQARAEEYTVEGSVVDDSRPLPGVSVALKGSAIGTSTDVDGQFTFPKPLKVGETLLFSFIGYDTQEFVITQQATDSLTISLDVAMTFNCDLVLMGEVAVERRYTSSPSFWQRITAWFR